MVQLVGDSAATLIAEMSMTAALRTCTAVSLLRFQQKSELLVALNI